MMTLLQDHYEIPVITISLDIAARLSGHDVDDPHVHFRVSIGAQPPVETSIAGSEMRLPRDLAAIAARAGVRKLHIPERVFDALERGLAGWRGDRPVWLRLGVPTSHLAAVPWEHLLQRRLGVALLRLPEVGLAATPPEGRLEVVLCASAPQECAPYDVRSSVLRVVEQLRDIRAGHTRVQVFIDDKRVRAFLRRHEPDLVVHAPPRTLHGREGRRGPDLVENGWLRWMAGAIGDDACIDIVHFICPGQLTSSVGSLKLDRSFFPAPPLAWSLVHASELVAFLTTLGAAGVGFTIPCSQAWPAGIRVLAHGVMKDLTGPVLVDAPYHDRSGAQTLRQAYTMLFGDGGGSAPRSPGLAIYAHPLHAARAVDRGERSDRTRVFEERTEAVVAELTLAPIVHGYASAHGVPEPPRWLGANQRVLERIAGEIVDPSADSALPRSSTQGVEDGLEFLTGVLERDITRFMQLGGGGGPETW